MTLPRTSSLSQQHVGDPAGQPLVTVIYVNWNCEEELLESVASVQEQTLAVPYEIVVVDNASPNGLGRLDQADGIRLVRSPRNGGFGAGCNLGAQHARGKYLLFLNPDTRLLNDTIAVLVHFMEAHAGAAIAGPMVVTGKGEISFEAARSLPTLANEFLQHSTLAFRFPRSRWAGRPFLSDWDHRSTREVEAVLGACMLTRKSFFEEVGGFDEKFFLYSEELDLCHRLRLANHSVWYVHDALILHKERQSTMLFFSSLNRVILQNIKSQYYYFRKNHGSAKALTWRGMIALLYLLRYPLSRDRGHLAALKWAVAEW